MDALPAFSLLRPTTLDEALKARAAHPDSSALGGGTDLKAQIEVIEPLGLSTQFYTKLSGHQTCIFAMGRTDRQPGDMIGLGIKPENVHLFHGASGLRIG